MNDETCLRCGLPESNQRHDRKNIPPEGWHPFRGQNYLDRLEDALLFVRENKQPHQWVETGMTVAIVPQFSEKRCEVCGATNWGGVEDGVCFGNYQAELGIIAAHNRRASKNHREFSVVYYPDNSPVNGTLTGQWSSGKMIQNDPK